MSGPKVDIYVGQDRKHYSVPKDLLCYYSPYFDSCFNGDFKEAKEQKLELLDDDVEGFEFLLEYILHAAFEEIEIPETEGNKQRVERCLKFLEYTDKYSMREAHHVIAEPLRRALDLAFPPIRTDKRRIKPVDVELVWRRIKPIDVELVYRASPVGSRVRKIIINDIFKYQGHKGYEFREQETEIPGFAVDVLNEIRSRGMF